MPAPEAGSPIAGHEEVQAFSRSSDESPRGPRWRRPKPALSASTARSAHSRCSRSESNESCTATAAATTSQCAAPEILRAGFLRFLDCWLHPWSIPPAAATRHAHGMEGMAEVACGAAELESVFARVADRFTRALLRWRMRDYVRGPLGRATRKNGWQLAEGAGHRTPDSVQ